MERHDVCPGEYVRCRLFGCNLTQTQVHFELELGSGQHAQAGHSGQQVWGLRKLGVKNAVTDTKYGTFKARALELRGTSEHEVAQLFTR